MADALRVKLAGEHGDIATEAVHTALRLAADTALAGDRGPRRRVALAVILAGRTCTQRVLPLSLTRDALGRPPDVMSSRSA